MLILILMNHMQKKQRRVTAAKRYSTDETDTFAGSLPVFPRQPIVQ